MVAAVFGNGSLVFVDGKVFDMATGDELATVWAPDDVTGVAVAAVDGGGLSSVVFRGDRSAPDVEVYRLDAAGAVVGQQVFQEQPSAGSGFGQSTSPDGV